MEYTIKKLGEMAGVSARTLRYYDEIGLLKPCRISSSGYRIYGEHEVDLLQQIMFYKTIGMKLEQIKETILNPSYDTNSSLIEHHKNLLLQKEHLEQLIIMVEKTISHNRGELNMSNKEKFAAFKKEKIKENEDKYGKEIRKKYGNESVDESYNKFSNISEEEFLKMNDIENAMIENLIIVANDNNLDSQEAKIVYENHKQWLEFNMSYNKKIHKSLAEMYVADERFAKYYNDKANREVVKTLKDIILKYAK